MSQLNLVRRAARYLRDNPLVIVALVITTLGLIMLLFPVPIEQTILAPQGEIDRFVFGGGRVVGQEFVPPTGLAQIRIPMGTTSEIRGPLILHLRERPDGPDLRSSVEFTFEGEEARFDFRPLLNPPHSLFWVLEGPHGTPKSFWVYREKDTTQSVGSAVIGTTKIVGNFGFTLVQQLPLLAVWFDPTPSEAHWNVAQVRPWEWYSMVFGVVAVVIFGYWRRRRIAWNEPVIVASLIAVSLLLHGAFAVHLPLINDEGAYIQDVIQAKTDFIPLRDYLTKGPAYLVLLKLWQLVTPHTVLAWRLFATVSWGVAVYATWQLTRQMKLTEPMRLVVVALMALCPAVIAVTTPLLLQTTSVPIMLFAIIAAMRGSQTNNRWLIGVAAFLINVAFFTRVSSIVAGLLGLLCIVYYSKHRKAHLITYVSIGLLVFVAVLVTAVGIVGWQRALVTINAEALLISSQRAEVSRAAASAEPLIRQLTHEARLFWRGALPLILGLFAAPLIFVSRRRLYSSAAILVVLLCVLYLIFFHLSDADYLLPAHFALVPAMQLLTIFGGIFVLIVALLSAPSSLPEQRTPHLFWLGILSFWLAAITIMYFQWGRFRQNYLVEFIPPLALLSGISLVSAWRTLRHIQPTWLSMGLRLAGVFLGVATAYQGMFLVWQYPHTGSLAQGSFRQFVTKTQQVVPPGELIFTAQPNVTAFSLRPIIFGNTHPGWYREARLGTIPENLRDLFFVNPDQVTEYLRREAKYVVMERRTYEIYFDGYPERQQILKDTFEKVVSVDNEREGEPLELFERRQENR